MTRPSPCGCGLIADLCTIMARKKEKEFLEKFERIEKADGSIKDIVPKQLMVKGCGVHYLECMGYGGVSI